MGRVHWERSEALAGFALVSSQVFSLSCVTCIPVCWQIMQVLKDFILEEMHDVLNSNTRT